MTDIVTLDGWGQRQATFRFDLLDQWNSYIGTLDVDADSAPTLTNNINQAAKRQLSGLRLPPSVTAQVNTLRDRVKPWMVFPDGQQFPLGVFLFADASRRLATSSSTQFATPPEGYITEGTMLDQLVTVNQGSVGVTFYGPGTSVQTALAQQLEAQGVYDYDIDTSDAQITQWVVWKPNTKRLQIINDLGKIGGYYSLFFNNDGRGQMRLVPSLSAVEPTLMYDAGTNVFANSIVETDDLLDAPNLYVVVNPAFTERPIWGQWAVPSSAPHSYANRGWYQVKEIDMQGVESNAAASKAAKAAGQADYSTYRWAHFDTAIDPRHDTFDIVGWKGDKYREQSWGFQLREGAPHKHELRRVWAEDVADEIEEAA